MGKKKGLKIDEFNSGKRRGLGYTIQDEIQFIMNLHSGLLVRYREALELREDWHSFGRAHY